MNPMRLSLIAIAVSLVPAFAGLSNIAPTGDVSFRGFNDLASGKDSKGVETASTTDFMMHYAWNFKTTVSATEFLSFGFRLSNPSGPNMDKIQRNDQLNSTTVTTTIDSSATPVSGKHTHKSTSSSATTLGVNRLLAVPEASVTLNLVKMAFSVGVVELKGNTVLDLVSIENNAYSMKSTSYAVFANWNNNMNMSQAGMLADVKAVATDPFTMTIKMNAGLAQDFGADTVAGNIGNTYNILKKDQMRFGMAIPIVMAGKKITLTPAMQTRTNVYRKDDTTGCASIHGGFDVAYKGAKGLAIRSGFAAGGYDKTNDVDTLKASAGLEKPLAMVAQGGATFTYKAIAPSVDLGWVSVRDRMEGENSIQNQFQMDVKFPVTVKGLTIMPRLRTWSTSTFAETDQYEKFQIRPELAFRASFK